MGTTDSWLGQLAGSIGSSETALRLLIALLLGYPMAAVYRRVIYGKDAYVQHLYFIATGLWLSYFNFGASTIHSVASILLNYLLLVTVGGTSLSVVLALVINMLYLCIGYYVNMDGTYQIRWTTAQCVLTLRLTGLVYDVYDGTQKQEKLSKEQQETALPERPGLLEMAAHTYFFGGFLVGPQFPMKRYQDLVRGAFGDPKTGGKPDSVLPGLSRLGAGIFYTAVYQVSSLFISDSDFLASWYKDTSFLWKCIHMTIWGKFMLYKYVACWLIAEGSCTVTGLTYNGVDDQGNKKWDVCANINIKAYELAKNFQQLVAAFNINTNRWIGKYVFKRLKFLGNKTVSQAVALLYLAVWHGLYTGYFMNFYLELVIMITEKDVISIFAKTGVDMWFRSPPMRLVKWCLCKLYMQFSLSYALVAFCLFTWDRWGLVYYQTYFVAVLLFTLYPFLSPFIKSAVLPKREINGNHRLKKEE